ncbi:MAG: prenyltransferase [Halobacteria archaeon]|nr:prenyltransferase [Halobacteria archaeon]
MSDQEPRLEYLFWLSRPRFWLYLGGPVLVGLVYASDSLAELFTPFNLALFLYFLVPANVMLYGVNDVFDADIDELNPKKDEKETRYSGDRAVLGAILLSTVAGIAFLPFLPTESALWLGAFYFLGIEYSAPPLRFKTTPVFDSVTNGLYVIPGIVAYTAVSSQPLPLVAIVGAWVWAMAMHTFSAIPDIEPDREAGISTTATVLGEKRTLVYCTLCWVAAAVAFYVVSPLVALLMAVFPVLSAALLYADADIERAYWWYPLINTFLGMILTMGGLWMIIYG